MVVPPSPARAIAFPTHPTGVTPLAAVTAGWTCRRTVVPTTTNSGRPTVAVAGDCAATVVAVLAAVVAVVVAVVRAAGWEVAAVQLHHTGKLNTTDGRRDAWWEEEGKEVVTHHRRLAACSL